MFLIGNNVKVWTFHQIVDWRLADGVLMRTAFDPKYIIDESFIDDLWAQRSDEVHICKHSEDIRTGRRNSLLRENDPCLLTSVDKKNVPYFSLTSFLFSLLYLLPPRLIHHLVSDRQKETSVIVHLSKKTKATKDKLDVRKLKQFDVTGLWSVITAPLNSARSRRTLRTAHKGSKAGGGPGRRSSPSAGLQPAKAPHLYAPSEDL